MRKLLLANIGAAVGVGAGTIGISYAITHKFVDNKKTNDNTNTINGILGDIGSLYDAHNQLKTTTEINVNNLYDYIQQSIAGTIASIETSTNKALQLQKDELLVEMQKISDALKAHNTLNDETFADIFTAISELSTKLAGVTDMQNDLKSKFDILSSNYEQDINVLSTAITNLQNLTNEQSVTMISLQVGMNELSLRVDGVEALKGIVITIQNDITAIIDRVTLVEQSFVSLSQEHEYDVNRLTQAIDALKLEQTSLNTLVTALESRLQSIDGEMINLSNAITSIKAGQNATNQQIQNIQQNITTINNEQANLKTQVQAINDQFSAINTAITNLFDGNATLKTRMDYLSSQNTQLFADFQRLQEAFNALQPGTGANILTINQSETDPQYTIYDATGNDVKIKLPTIKVTNLSRAQKFEINAKVTTAGRSYVTNLINLSATFGTNIFGTATQSSSNEQFLISANLDKTNNNIIIDGVWAKNSNSSEPWKSDKHVANTKVQIINVIVTY